MSNIGRTAVIAYQGKSYVGTVIDLVAGTDQPKRIRITRDVFLQGQVLQPSQYDFKGWAEDD